MTSLPRDRGFDWTNLGLRIASGLVLATGALWAVWAFDGAGVWWRLPFFLLVSGAGVLLSLEWARMATPSRAAVVGAVTAIAAVAVALLAFVGFYWQAWAAMVLGAGAAALLARGSGAPATSRRLWRALHRACRAGADLAATILARRGLDFMLLATTWAADIGAFAVGNVVKGPKLWPRFSPNKTWSGFIGGLLAAAAASVAVAAGFMRLSLIGAAVIGMGGGLATMAGDLWELMLKRRFGVKDSGDLIPGHGGLLDRVDGLMFAVMVFALARLVVHLGWAH